MNKDCIVMDEDIITINYNGILSEEWIIECSCNCTFTNRLLSNVRSQWRRHAGVTDRRMVNDATILSK